MKQVIAVRLQLEALTGSVRADEYSDWISGRVCRERTGAIQPVLTSPSEGVVPGSLRREKSSAAVILGLEI